LCTEDAKKGKGSPVLWASEVKSNYSRLCSDDPEDSKFCIVVDDGEDLLWAKTNCEDSYSYALCVKRNCIEEN
jgi:hypothetical protein